ncbi:MAG: hypothetical protein ACXVY5_07030 [Gaiellales bacterium]
MSTEKTPQSDVVEEASRVLSEAQQAGVQVRLLGGLAVRLHAPEGLHPAVRREYKDIDLVTLRGKGRPAGDLMQAIGYDPNREFNAMNGHRRLLFYDVPHERQVDVFVGSFEMCHVIPISARMDVDPVTVPLAELLLTKLQVVHLNEKDQRDILALLYHHEVGDTDDDTVNGAYVGQLCAADWGLWRTCKMNIERSREALPQYAFSPDERGLVLRRLDDLWAGIEVAPKGAKWKLRDRVGDRKKWYEEPEEVD